METYPLDIAVKWQIGFHESMAALLRVHEGVQRQVGWTGILKRLWETNRDLKSLSADMKAMSERPDGSFDEQFIKSHVQQVRKLLLTIESLYDTATRKGLTSRPMTGGAFESIRSRTEYIADYLDTLEMSIDPAVLAAIQEGHDQMQDGDFEVMDRLF